MTQAVREQVRSRADFRCEYCRLPQYAVPSTTFHIEHIVARQHHGSDELSNLALSCERCNVFKGTKLSSVDPLRGAIVAIFNPRTQNWFDHFQHDDFEIVGITEIGRATASLLNMNAPKRVLFRKVLRIDFTS